MTLTEREFWEGKPEVYVYRSKLSFWENRFQMKMGLEREAESSWRYFIFVRLEGGGCWFFVEAARFGQHDIL